MKEKIIPKCAVCKLPLVQLEKAQTAVCTLCGETFESFAKCEKGHHVCPLCRQKSVREQAYALCLNSKEKNPFTLLTQMMDLPETLMHGPEHHFFMPAAFLTAYCNEKNLGARLSAWLDEANKRSIQVPGAVCGLWGICGAVIGGGIYISILTESGPLATDAWKQTGQLVAHGGNVVSAQGGPRCCKRDSFLSLIETARYSNQLFKTNFVVPDITCDYFPSNQQCKGKNCPFFPGATQVV